MHIAEVVIHELNYERCYILSFRVCVYARNGRKDTKKKKNTQIICRIITKTPHNKHHKRFYCKLFAKNTIITELYCLSLRYILPTNLFMRDEY